MSLKGTLRDDVNCIQMVQDRVQWRAFVNKELNSEVPLKNGILFDQLKKGTTHLSLRASLNVQISRNTADPDCKTEATVLKSL